MIDNAHAMENVEPRPDILPKVTGKAKYMADMYPKNVLYAKYIRFPFGKGTATASGLDAARKVPGIISVNFNSDVQCQYPGHRIGEIVGESIDAIEDAEEALKLKFTFEKPRSKAAPFYEGVPDADSGEQTRLDQLFADADTVIEATYTTQVQTHSCFEAHGAVVDYKGEEVEGWVSTQAVQGCEGQLAKAAGVSEARTTVHSEFMGGGFGSKFSIGPWGQLATRLSKAHGRPVRVILDRREEHLDGNNRPGTIQYMKIAAKDGKLAGGRIHCVSTVGYPGGGGGVRNPNNYAFGEIVRTEAEIPLNGGLPSAFRAPGYPPGTFALESMMDELAAALKLDPIQFRKQNETSRRRVRQWEQGAKLIGWAERKADGTWPGRVKRGYGCAASGWGNSKGRCEVETDVYRSGRVEVRIGIQDIGTGANVLPVDVTAWHLGLPRDLITGKVGNSNYPPGPASGGSVTSRFTAPAVRDAAQKAMERVRRDLAAEWDMDEKSISYKEGMFSGDGRQASWQQACSLLSSEKITAHGEFNDDYWESGTSDCTQFVIVEVDTETGIVRVKKVVAIQCCGKPVNRLTAENQIHGGVIQGISYALFEDRVLDGPTGGFLNDGLIYYKIAGPTDIPEIVPVLDVNEGEEGVRSIGEPVTIPTSGAIANAVANAIGVRVRDLPITPERVLRALENKQGGAP